MPLPGAPASELSCRPVGIARVWPRKDCRFHCTFQEMSRWPMSVCFLSSSGRHLQACSWGLPPVWRSVNDGHSVSEHKWLGGEWERCHIGRSPRPSAFSRLPRAQLNRGPV